MDSFGLFGLCAIAFYLILCILALTEAVRRYLLFRNGEENRRWSQARSALILSSRLVLLLGSVGLLVFCGIWIREGRIDFTEGVLLISGAVLGISVLAIVFLLRNALVLGLHTARDVSDQPQSSAPVSVPDHDLRKEDRPQEDGATDR